MSDKIEYNTVIDEDGTIHIPEYLRKELPAGTVHVTLEPFKFPPGVDAISIIYSITRSTSIILKCQQEMNYTSDDFATNRGFTSSFPIMIPYSEDMQDGLDVEGVMTIRNPFRG